MDWACTYTVRLLSIKISCVLTSPAVASFEPSSSSEFTWRYTKSTSLFVFPLINSGNWKCVAVIVALGATLRRTFGVFRLVHFPFIALVYHSRMHCYAPAPRVWGIKRWCASDVCLSDVCLSVAYIGPKSRTEKPTERLKLAQRYVGHVTRDSDTTLKVKRSKVNLQGAGAIAAASRTACYWSALTHSITLSPVVRTSSKCCSPSGLFSSAGMYHARKQAWLIFSFSFLLLSAFTACLTERELLTSAASNRDSRRRITPQHN